MILSGNKLSEVLLEPVAHILLRRKPLIRIKSPPFKDEDSLSDPPFKILMKMRGTYMPVVAMGGVLLNSFHKNNLKK